MTRLLLVAAALVAMLAAAGVGAGAGTPIPDVVDGAGDAIYVHEGANARECGRG